VARVLKPGARFIVQLPAYQWLWSMHDVAVGHQRRYDAPSLGEKNFGRGLATRASHVCQHSPDAFHRRGAFDEPPRDVERSHGAL